MEQYPDPTGSVGETGTPYYPPSPIQQRQQHNHPHTMSHPDELRMAAELGQGLQGALVNPGPGGNMSDNSDYRIAHHPFPQQPSNGNGHPMHSGHAQMVQNHQYSHSDGSKSTKQTKASRACDECRRKKVKCNADELNKTGDRSIPCSNCKRVGIACNFSREQQRRGPSKGYIKDLESRVHNLEKDKLQPNNYPVQQLYGSPPQRRQSEDLSSPSPQSAGAAQAKRDYSSMSGELGHTYQPNRNPGAWQPQDVQRQHPSATARYSIPYSSPGSQQTIKEATYTANGLGPEPQWKDSPKQPLIPQPTTDSMDRNNHTEPASSNDLDADLLISYYKLIHPTFSILPRHQTTITGMLAQCSLPLAVAFKEALRLATCSFPEAHLPGGSAVSEVSVSHAATFIFKVQSETAPRSYEACLVLLQSMLLMAIAVGNIPAHSGPSQSTNSSSFWLGNAVVLAYSMKLHLHKSLQKGSEEDTDSDSKLRRRTWWALVILDRWDASGTARPLLIPASAAQLYRDDKSILGEHMFQLARLSNILGHFSQVDVELVHQTNANFPSVLGTFMSRELEVWREDLPETVFAPGSMPLIHVSYLHLRILAALRDPNCEPAGLLSSVTELVTVLSHETLPISPLIHYPIGLAALTLIDLCTYAQSKEGAQDGLQVLLEGRRVPSGWDSAIRELIIKQKQRTNTSLSTGGAQAIEDHSRTASVALQRLAELATSSGGDQEDNPILAAGGEGKIEFQKANPGNSTASSPPHYDELRDLVRGGYLKAFDVSGGDSGR